MIDVNAVVGKVFSTDHELRALTRIVMKMVTGLDIGTRVWVRTEEGFREGVITELQAEECTVCMDGDVLCHCFRYDFVQKLFEPVSKPLKETA